MASPNFSLGLGSGSGNSPDQQESSQIGSNQSDEETQPQPEEIIHEITQICCVGAGRLGVISMLVMASRCPDVFITVVDKNAAKINAWDNPQQIPQAQGGGLKFPIYEPGLEQLYQQVMATNRLGFSTDFDQSVFNADIIFIAVEITSLPKPAKKKGRLEVDSWDYVCRLLKDVVNIEDKIIVTLSTVPLNFKSLLSEIFANAGQLKFLLNPSFLSEGTAIEDTEHPPQVLIAYDLDPNNQLINDLVLENLGVVAIRNLYLHWVNEDIINVVNGFASATMSKLVINVGLGTQISLMNSIALVCSDSNSSENANIDVVTNAFGRVPRLRNEVFNPQPSVGFGGSGLVKDISYLALVASSSNRCEAAADFFKGILKVNEGTRKSFVKNMHLKMNSIKGKKFAILGFTYKSNTENINNSPAIGICQELLKKEGAAEIRIFDPQAKQADIELYFSGKSEKDRVKVRPSAKNACLGVDAIVLLTDWPEFLGLDYTNIHANMRLESSKDFFIGREMDGFPDLTDIGFRVHHIGRH